MLQIHVRIDRIAYITWGTCGACVILFMQFVFRDYHAVELFDSCEFLSNCGNRRKRKNSNHLNSLSFAWMPEITCSTVRTSKSEFYSIAWWRANLMWDSILSLRLLPSCETKKLNGASCRLNFVGVSIQLATQCLEMNYPPYTSVQSISICTFSCITLKMYSPNCWQSSDKNANGLFFNCPLSYTYSM